MAPHHYPIQSVKAQDSEFPYLLSQMPSPPKKLFYKGALSAAGNLTLSVVGSRKMTAYGARVLGMFIPPLVRAGLTIVSGLAYGVDSYAHTEAVKHGGTCIAVLGGGLDSIYPPSNQGLARSIMEGGGCLLSEYPEGTAIQSYHFPQRNRIIAGLSMVTLIVEAGPKSGTLITAREALDAGREVCVVPGDITRETSQGIYMLLRQGASPVTCVQDILDLYNLKLPLYGGATGNVTGLTEMQANLYDSILRQPSTTNSLIEESGLPVQDVQRALSALELRGLISFNHRTWLPISS